MKILVTGSSGFIGFHLIEKLLNVGHNVIGIDNENDYYCQKLKFERKKRLNTKGFKFFKQDINDINNKFKNVDLAIHLAAQPGVRLPKEKEYLYQSSNINGFESFCDLCIRSKIQKIIYASSSSVYCDLSSKKFSESNTKLNPKSIYGESKLANEVHASKIASKFELNMVGLRFFSVYGPFGRPDMAYYSFTKSLKERKKIKLYNGGNMSRDMTYIDDIVQGIMGSIDYIFKNENCSNEIINLGNDSPISTSTLLFTLESKLRIKANFEIVNSSNEAFQTHADISKAKKLLGYNPKVKFEEGISNFLNWHKDFEHL